jgi:hypothetical protein
MDSSSLAKAIMAAHEKGEPIEPILCIDNWGWLFARCAALKRQHRKHAGLFNDIESADFMRHKFGNPGDKTSDYVSSNPVIQGYHTRLTAPAPTTEGHLCDAVLDALAAAVPAHTKGIKKHVLRMLFVIFADLRDGVCHVARVGYYMQHAVRYGLQKEFAEVLRFPMRHGYLIELSMYHFGHAAQDMLWVIPLDVAAAMPSIPPAVHRTPQGLLDQARRIKGQRGLHTLVAFRERLSAYCGGIFDGISFEGKKYKMALTGSCITASAPINPLENAGLLANMYCADIAGAVPVKYQIIMDSDESSESSEEAPVVEAQSKSMRRRRLYRTDTSMIVPKVEPQVKMPSKYTSDIDLAVECAIEDFDEAVADIFAPIRVANPGARLTQEATENKHKYYIRGLYRTIDIFHVRSIPYIVSKFHLDIVRAYWDGTQLWCFPSFVLAAMSGMNTDIRWTSNKKDVRDTVLKYFARGYGTYLNGHDSLNLSARVSGATPQTRWRYVRLPEVVLAEAAPIMQTKNEVHYHPLRLDKHPTARAIL